MNHRSGSCKKQNHHRHCSKTVFHKQCPCQNQFCYRIYGISHSRNRSGSSARQFVDSIHGRRNQPSYRLKPKDSPNMVFRLQLIIVSRSSAILLNISSLERWFTIQRRTYRLAPGRIKVRRSHSTSHTRRRTP
mgnify:CR=1 FL=1